MAASTTARIFDIRAQIHTNISQVHANRVQCQRLSERIDQLIDPLERLEHAPSSLLRQETRPILERLLQCLDDSNDLIKRFTSPTQWCQEVYKHQIDHEKFEALNKRLSELGQDLSLGLNIQQLFDRKQDQEDQQQDLQDLTEKLNQISQQMLQQQQDQYKLMDKMINRRFQSFRYHLAQNLLMQQDSIEAQVLVAERDKFLHIPYKDLYIEEKPLGSGGFADVFKGIWLTHHDQVAVKVLRINHLSGDSQSGVRADFYREISTMHRIRYENVLTVLGACIEPSFYAIIVEYMPLGSLYDILHGKCINDEIITFSWPDRYSLAWQMAKSINYLHNFNPCILHRDIKSMNFLMKRDGSDKHRFLVKVSDFGLAEIRRETLLQSTMNLSQTVGSVAWKAPELFARQGRHTKQTDVYSLAIVYWELATGMKPWDEYADETIMLMQVKTGERPSIPSDVPKQYQKIIQDAWDSDPHKRPTCFELMERIHKHMEEKTERDPLTTSNQQKDERTMSPVDLNPQQIITQHLTSVISITDSESSSTRTSIQVAELEEEQRRLTYRLSNMIILENEQAETGEESSSTVLLPTEAHHSDDKIQQEHPATTQIISEPPLNHSVSSSSLINIEQQQQTTTTGLAATSSSSSVHQLKRTLSKSADDLPATLKPVDASDQSFNRVISPMYTIEKRRPLHAKPIWAEKSLNSGHQIHTNNTLPRNSITKLSADVHSQFSVKDETL